MKLTKTLVAVLTMLATTMAVHASDKQVSFTVLRNYFHNSNAPSLSSPLITNKQTFDEQFGMAAFMGKGGQPTPVNFGKSAVLAIVLPETNKAIDIDSVMVTETGKKELTLAYTVHEGAEQSFYIRPLQLMAIDKRYKSYQVKVVPTVRREVSTSTSSFDTYFYKDSRHGLTLSVDYPTGGNKALVKGVREWVGNRLGIMAKTFTFSDDKQAADAGVDVNAKVSAFVQAYAVQIASNMNRLNKGNGGHNCALTASINRVWENDRYVSFEVDGYYYTGGAHGMSFCNGATFDKQTGKQVTLIQGDATLQKMLTERLKKASGVEHFSEEPVPMPKAAPYVVAGGKIKFIYQPYEIGAYAIGRPECEFYPYELDKWLTKDGKGLMNR